MASLSKPTYVAGAIALISFSLHAASVAAADEQQSKDYLANPDLVRFIDKMVERHQFDHASLRRLFSGVRQQARVLEAISRPAEAKPWHQYRLIFLTPERVEAGVKFWVDNGDILGRAEQAFGVPASMIVAIIGVETFYGRHTGKYPVLDTLTTLGFDYPPRGSFFRSELEHYLLLSREEAFDPTKIRGSYAGAMGQGQFISSSYRNYAVDFDSDGARNLWDSTADAIGSVANYFKRHGWQAGEPVVVEAAVNGDGYRKLLGKGMKPSLSPETLSAHGVKPLRTVGDAKSVSFYELEGADEAEYWIGLHNFYVITRYNRSPLYALAAFQLSQSIEQAKKRPLTARLASP
jgi:membrane-bound lytic murein transglycosylase B